MRQAKESPIIQIATKLRKCIETQEFMDLKEIVKEECSEEIECFIDKKKFIESYYSDENWYKENKILASYTNNEVDDFNTLIRDQYWKEKGTSLLKIDSYLSGDMIRFKENLSSDGLFQKSERTLFHNGEEVMINIVKYIYHQETKLKFWKCTVLGRSQNKFFRVIDPDSIITYNKLLLKFANCAKDNRYPYNKLSWKKYFSLKNAFAKVQYIFASTIHKLQGSTYDTVHIDLASLLNNKQMSDDLKYRLAYVAITRARKKVKILY